MRAKIGVKRGEHLCQSEWLGMGRVIGWGNQKPTAGSDEKRRKKKDFREKQLVDSSPAGLRLVASDKAKKACTPNHSKVRNLPKDAHLQWGRGRGRDVGDDMPKCLPLMSGHKLPEAYNETTQANQTGLSPSAQTKWSDAQPPTAWTATTLRTC
ncbi:hypothetical protein SRHO_G00123460 [Serrasalmus rhombeus]